MTDVREGDVIELVYKGRVKDADTSMIYIEGRGWMPRRGAEVRFIEKVLPVVGDMINSVEDLKRLPEDSVIRSADHGKGNRKFIALNNWRGDGLWWGGDGLSRRPESVSLPVKILAVG